MKKPIKYPVIQVIFAALAIATFMFPGCKHGTGPEESSSSREKAVEEIPTLFGIDYRDMVFEEGTIGPGQTVSAIFDKYGIGPALTDRTEKASRDVFNLRNIQAGKNYTVFMTDDSLQQVKHFVYEHSLTDFLVISFEGDSVSVRKDMKDVTLKRTSGEAVIETSLWVDMVKNGM
jgi:hypothetical protein